MSTKFYVKPEPCEHCGQARDSTPIGVSSVGWVFQLYSKPELGLVDLESWIKYLLEHEKCIYNEYNTKLTISEMLRIILRRKEGLSVPDRAKVRSTTYCLIKE